MSIFFWILQLVFIPAISPLLIGVTRKIKAKLQNRQGASVLQPYRDLIKLFHKDEVISADASWIFTSAPFILFGTTVAIGACIPIVSSALSSTVTGDFLVVVYLFALGTFWLALAGMDTGSAFGGFGSSREMMVAAFTEGGLVLSLLSLVLISGSSNLTDVAVAIHTLPLQSLAPVVVAAIAFTIALLAETARYPFDNPATHLELTMIHEAMILEYSGKRLALMEWASANKYALFLTLAATLFLPGSIAATTSLLAVALGLILLFFKLLILVSGIATLESSIAKLRIFRLPDLLFTSCLLGIIAIGLILI